MNNNNDNYSINEKEAKPVITPTTIAAIKRKITAPRTLIMMTKTIILSATNTEVENKVSYAGIASPRKLYSLSPGRQSS